MLILCVLAPGLRAAEPSHCCIVPEIIVLSSACTELASALSALHCGLDTARGGLSTIQKSFRPKDIFQRD